MLPPVNCAIAIIQHIAIHILGYLVLGLEKIMEFSGKTPEFVINCFYSSLELATTFFNGGYDFGVATFQNIVEFSTFGFEKFVEFSVYAFETATVWSIMLWQNTMATLEYGVSYYKNNQENPRLFSEMFKQIRYQ